VAGSSADIVVLKDEDWGDAAVDLQPLLDEDVVDDTIPAVAARRGEASEDSFPGRIGWWCPGCRHHLLRSRFCLEVSRD